MGRADETPRGRASSWLASFLFSRLRCRKRFATKVLEAEELVVPLDTPHLPAVPASGAAEDHARRLGEAVGVPQAFDVEALVGVERGGPPAATGVRDQPLGGIEEARSDEIREGGELGVGGASTRLQLAARLAAASLLAEVERQRGL